VKQAMASAETVRIIFFIVGLLARVPWLMV